MKTRHVIALTAALSFSATAFAADDAEALYKKSGCPVCHKVDGKGMGPSFKEIAAKYKDDKGAQARLEAKVRSGGNGSFGSMSMPATGAAVSDANIKTLVAWVLSQK